MNCSKCNLENEESAKFCSDCGANLFAIKTCPKCNFQGNEDSHFCKNCGTKLIDKPIESPKPTKTKKGWKSKKIFLVIIAVTIVVAVAVVVFFMFKNKEIATLSLTGNEEIEEKISTIVDVTATIVSTGVWADAVYWKDGKCYKLSLPSGATDSRASGIVVSNDVVYISGSYGTSSDGGDSFACYWIDGVIYNLSLPSGAKYPRTSGIAVYDDLVYITGSYSNDQYKEFPCYWRNGIIHNLSIPSGAISPRTSGIVVSGDVVYIAGSYYAQSKSTACYWRNGIINNLPLPGGATESYVGGIAVSDDVLYIAGTYIIGDWNKGGKAIPCYWKNGIINNLTLPNGEDIWHNSINSITVVGDVVYIAGTYCKGDPEVSYKVSPCYWRNSTLHNLSLPSGTDCCSGASAIAVFDNILHIAGSPSYFGASTICYWKNGVAQSWKAPAHLQKYVRITGIAKSGNSVYFAATLWMQ